MHKALDTHIQAAWEAYHGPDIPTDLTPGVPPVFRRGFLDGYEHALKQTITPEDIREYFKFRGMVWPSSKEALDFAITELAGEALEAYIRENQCGWVRNNPDKTTNFGWELADCYQMIAIAVHEYTGKSLPTLLREKWASKGFQQKEQQ